MANWRDAILKEFQPKISRLTLVADPDELLTEEGMLSAIQDRGFDLITFDDSIAFRLAYESQYRSKWDNGQSTDLVVVLRSAEQQLNKLPFDLLMAGRHLAFSLHQLFPKLNYPVIAGLDRSYLDAIDDGYRKYDGAQLTERGTKEFVLKKCFAIVPEILTAPVELLKLLLSLHYRKVQLPEILVEYLQESIAMNGTLATWPLSDIHFDRQEFLRFLQDEWKVFVDSQDDPTLQSQVPFAHEDVRAYIDSFFLDGSLMPVEHEDTKNLPSWMQTGIAHDSEADALRRFYKLREQFEGEFPANDVSHRDWQQAALRWAELVVLRWEWDAALDAADRTAWDSLQERVERAFCQWMLNRYGSLYNLPYQQRPVMVHQISRYMAFERNRRKTLKSALLVLDGLALDQWLLLRKNLEMCDPAWRFQESTAFAWVPTLTSVTRQSIFSGEPPLYFPDSLATNSKEKAHWQRFWEDQGVQRAGVDLVTSIDGSSDSNLEAALENPRLSVLGIVWNKVDDIMHGMKMQTAGMHSQVRLWASQGHLQQLLRRLWDEGFVIYVTADHGNVAATGIGNPRDGVLVETKGKRVRVYDRPEFLDETASRFPQSFRWPNHGLPPARHILMAEGLKAFTAASEEIVSHGGIALEEVMVPFVAITRERT